MRSFGQLNWVIIIMLAAGYQYVIMSAFFE